MNDIFSHNPDLNDLEDTMKKNRINKNLPVLYKLLLTQSISLIGTRMTAIALGLWLYQRTGHAMDLLLIPLFNELPSLLFGQVIGTFVDRLKRKTVLIVSDLGQVIGTVILIYVIHMGLFQTAVLYAVVFIQGIFTAAQEPAADATIGQFTNAYNRSRINGIKELTFPAAGVMAPALGGLLYVKVGILGVLAVDITTFMVSALIVAYLNIPDVSRSKDGRRYEGTFWNELKGGMGFIWNNKGLFWLVVFMSLFNFLVNGPLELVIPFILEITDNELTVSLMLSLMGLSTGLTSIILSSVVLPRKRMTLFAKAMLVTGVGLFTFGISRNLILLGGALFVLMMPLPLMNVIFKTTLQDKVPSDIQGRVFASSYQVAYGTAPLSFLLTGYLTDRVLEPFLIAGKGLGMGHLIEKYLVSPQSGAPAILFIGSGVCLICMAMIVSRAKKIGV